VFFVFNSEINWGDRNDAWSSPVMQSFSITIEWTELNFQQSQFWIQYVDFTKFLHIWDATLVWMDPVQIQDVTEV
jgi:hypothetical protein